MIRYVLAILLVASLILTSCKNESASQLFECLQTEYAQPNKIDRISSGSKVQYIQLEKKLNKKYVEELDSLISTSFNRQLEHFEEEELGVWSSYMNMFAWLFKSKQSWDDEMNIMSNRYFNTLDINQEQHASYIKHRKNIEELRQQFLVSKGLPSYSQISLPLESVTLASFSEHSRNNLVIEFGTELFSWFLGFILVQIVLLFVDKMVGPAGCLIDIFVFVIIVVVSVIMSSSNDNKLIESLRNQYDKNISYDYDTLLKSLDKNTINFYEKL